MQKQNCENNFCKLYTKKRTELFSGLMTKKEKKKYSKNNYLNKKIKNQTMKTCKLYFCNDGCKGTILEKGKRFPKLNKLVKQEEFYGKKWIRNFRKKLFKNRTDILVDNVQDIMPPKLTKKYKSNGAISICDHYIPNGSLEYIGKQL